jgi:hypothetical protein
MYMKARRIKKDLCIDSSDWIFSVSKGWNDWFTSFEDSQVANHPFPKQWDPHAFEESLFTWKEYREALPNVLSPQPYLLEMAEYVKKEFGLTRNEYASIFIRRGCKIKFESEYFETRDYVNRIFKEWPECKKIFVQTDDYRAYLEVKELVPPGVDVFTRCPEDKLGSYVFEYTPFTDHRIDKPENHAYLEKCKDIPRQKPVVEMSKDEMKLHVIEMLVGLIICQDSRGVALDYYSNVSRYIALSHKDGLSAIWNIDEKEKFSVENENELIRCPRWYPFYLSS